MNRLRVAVNNLHPELIQRARRFDRKAQGKLYELYCKAMYNTSLRIVNDPYAAEDVMQEAFIEAFRKLHQFKEESTFGAWLKRIVINRSINYIKKEKLLERIAEESKNDFEVQDGKLNEHDFTMEEIKQCLIALPKKYSLIFNLYLIEGYDHEEIAEILNISSATSRSQLSRAKRKMREQLETKKVNL